MNKNVDRNIHKYNTEEVSSLDGYSIEEAIDELKSIKSRFILKHPTAFNITLDTSNGELCFYEEYTQEELDKMLESKLKMEKLQKQHRFNQWNTLRAEFEKESTSEDESSYLIPESQLFRLLETCSNANHCTPNHKEHCECRAQVAMVENSKVFEEVGTSLEVIP